MAVVSPEKPAPEDFGVKPEEYALYAGQDSTPYSDRAMMVGAIATPLIAALVMFVITGNLGTAVGYGFLPGFLPGSLFGAVIISEIVIAIERHKWSRMRDELLESPVGAKIELYEEAKAAYDAMREEAERVRQEEEKAQQEAEKERREAERVQRRAERTRSKAETARLEVERARRRKFEDYWLSLNGTEFEREMARVLRALGYRVKSTPGSGDGGVDLILTRSGKTIVVQCKAHKNPVGPAIARELFGSMIHFKADQAILACTGGFTGGVKDFVRDKPIGLISLSELVRLGAQVEGKEIRDTPICTKCERAMVLKNGKYGAFWGCSRYPKCRVTRDASDW